jgi:5-methylcytosine-specific restriction protein A
MPITAIASGITREDVLQAISALKSGSVQHQFHKSERYDLIHQGDRFAPKAVLGVAAKRTAGRLLTPADFKGGKGSTCFRVLRDLGFLVERKPATATPAFPNFIVGKEYNRRTDIHGQFGGQMQGGISTPTAIPAVFLFTGDAGESHGYEDKFTEDGVFHYTGEGQVGDMKFERGNLAIRESANDGRKLLLFEQTRKGYVRFVGYAFCLGHHNEQRPDGDGALRSAIVFELEVTVDKDPIGTGPEGPYSRGVIDIHLPKVKSLEELRAAALMQPPAGLSSKQRKYVVYYRAAAVKRYVLGRAKGVCEGCHEPAPFLNRKKQPYLEPHHTTRRADGGPDHPSHVIALCPTCHRRVHHGIDGAEFNESLIGNLIKIEPR